MKPYILERHAEGRYYVKPADGFGRYGEIIGRSGRWTAEVAGTMIGGRVFLTRAAAAAAIYKVHQRIGSAR